MRRCRYEVGAEITGITPVAAEFRYCETDPSGIVENEICPVFAAGITNELTINSDEVMAYEWVDLDALFGLWMPHRGPLARMVMEATAARENCGPSPPNKKPRRLSHGAFTICRRYLTGRIAGNRITSRMVWLLVNSITIRSIPIPRPAVGGRPCSSAVT